MHFVDDIHLETSVGRRVQRALQQVAHVINLGIGRSIQLDQIDEASAVNFTTGSALAARRRGDTCQTIQGFGEYARNRGLAYPACSGKQIGMMQAILCQRVAKRPDDIFLPHQLREGFRPPFTCENRGI